MIWSIITKQLLTYPFLDENYPRMHYLEVTFWKIPGGAAPEPGPPFPIGNQDELIYEYTSWFQALEAARSRGPHANKKQKQKKKTIFLYDLAIKHLWGPTTAILQKSKTAKILTTETWSQGTENLVLQGPTLSGPSQ